LLTNKLAESVAEHAEKPLYAVTAADFTNKITVIESKLNDVFDLAAHWNAVLLIDEADVILTRRTFADVERNAVVAGKYLYHRDIMQD
jgi:AAA+ superfamily predicted ATPase